MIVHVNVLAHAHLLAIKFWQRYNSGQITFNSLLMNLTFCLGDVSCEFSLLLPLL
jgi:hypothetical protein